MIHLANTALNKVRRRVQHTTVGHRSPEGDPIYRIHRRFLEGHKRLNPEGFERATPRLEHGDPHREVTIAYIAK